MCHEAPAPTTTDAQPAAAGLAREAVAAVTRTRARGFGPALTPSVKVSSLPLKPGGFFF
jgi:hypothetical protein